MNKLTNTLIITLTYQCYIATKILVMTAMGYMPNMAGYEVTVCEWHYEFSFPH